jgi:hypothetical protein
MKIIKGILILAIFAILFPSCKKDYTCSCIVSKETYTYSYKGETNGEASNTCSKQNAAAKMADPAGVCSLTKK